MDIRKDQDSSYGKWFLTDVIRAIENYSLINDGEEVCVALSGGRDSVTLLYILWYLRRYSHLDFGLRAVHVRTDEYDTGILKRLCDDLGVGYLETRLKADLHSCPRHRALSVPPSSGAPCWEPWKGAGSPRWLSVITPTTWPRPCS